MTDADLKAIEERAAGIFLPGVPAEVRRETLGVWSFAPYDPHSQADAEFHAHAREDIPALIAEVKRLKGLLQSTADENYGAPSGHCCLNCPWCDGEGWDPFVHGDACPAYTPDGKVR